MTEIIHQLTNGLIEASSVLIGLNDQLDDELDTELTSELWTGEYSRLESELERILFND